MNPTSEVRYCGNISRTDFKKTMAFGRGPFQLTRLEREPLDPNLPLRIKVDFARVDKSGKLTVRGSVLSPKDVEEVRILAAGKELGPVKHPVRRIDVHSRHPEYRDERSGFVLITVLDATMKDLRTLIIEPVSAGAVLDRKEVSIRR